MSNKLSNFETTLLVKSRLFGAWFLRNRWVGWPALVLAFVIGWSFPFIGIGILVLAAIYAFLMWNIMTKV